MPYRAQKGQPDPYTLLLDPEIFPLLCGALGTKPDAANRSKVIRTALLAICHVQISAGSDASERIRDSAAHAFNLIFGE